MPTQGPEPFDLRGTRCIRGVAFVVVALIVTAVALASGAGCGRAEGDHGGSAPAIAELSVEELAAVLERGGCTVVDANGDRTRRRMGVIPGARLLTDHEAYAVAELPPARDSKLVFYCANDACSASHVAARKAVAAGYTDVAVLPAGIAGWKAAGKPVAAPRGEPATGS